MLLKSEWNKMRNRLRVFEKILACIIETDIFCVINYVFNNASSKDMDFFNQTGKLAIGSRLRMLTDKITVDAAAIYKMFGVDLKPKWFPVFFVLSRGEAKTITSIAKEIGHSHPSVSNIIKEMVAKGLVKETKDEIQTRKNTSISAKGKRMSETLLQGNICRCYDHFLEQITQQTRNDLWKAIEE